MAAKPTGLGRGLGALLQKTGSDEQSDVLADGSYYAEIPLDAVHPNPRQPRQVFDEDALAELVESVREVGVLQPIVVREVSGGAYELIMGERRLRASKLAGRDDIPAIVRGTGDGDMLRDALLENLHRANLNPLEEAAAYQQLLDDFGCTQEQLSQRIKRSRPQISNTIRLLKLPTGVQLKVAAGVLSAGHARALLSIDDADAQLALATRIIAEGLSVRSVEELVALRQPAKVRKPAKPRVPSPRATEVATVLSDHFDTRVRVAIGRDRGRIVIEFAGEDDLARILAIVNHDTVNM